LLKTMQRGVNRSLREVERLAALAFDFLDHRIATETNPLLPLRSCGKYCP
jgi:hypothetical protein